MLVVVDCDGDYYPYYHINGQSHCGCHCYKFPAWSHTTPPPTFRPTDLNCWCLHLDGRHWQGQPTNPSSWGDLSVCQSAIIKEFPVWRQHAALKWPGQSVRVTSYLRMYWELWQLGHVWVGDNPDLGEQPDRTVSLLHWEGDQLSSAFVLGHTGPDMFHFLCEGVKQIKKIKKFGINLLWNLIFQNIKALFLSIF